MKNPSPKIDLDQLNQAYKATESKIREGGEGAVEAAHRLSELQAIGKSEEFYEAAMIEDGLRLKEREQLADIIKKELLAGNITVARKLFKDFIENYYQMEEPGSTDDKKGLTTARPGPTEAPVVVPGRATPFPDFVPAPENAPRLAEQTVVEQPGETLWHELHSRVLQNMTELSSILYEDQNEIERWIQEHLGDLDVEIDWPKAYLCLLGVRGSSKGLALPRAGAHLGMPWRDWFKLPLGLNAAITGIRSPAIIENRKSSEPTVISRGEVIQ